MSGTAIEKFVTAYEALAASIATNPVSASFRALLLECGDFAGEWLGTDAANPEVIATFEERRRDLARRLRNTPMDPDATPKP